MEFFRFATCGVGRVHVVGVAIDFTDGANHVSVLFQSEETTAFTVVGTALSLGAGGATSTELYPVVSHAVQCKSVAEDPDGRAQESGESRESRKQFQKETSRC